MFLHFLKLKIIVIIKIKYYVTENNTVKFLKLFHLKKKKLNQPIFFSVLLLIRKTENS